MSKNYKVIGVRNLKLSQFSVDALKSLARQANEGIRKEHKDTVKKVLKKVKEQEKVDIKTAKKKLADDLQKKLIRVAKRRKADLISDIKKNKKHIPAMQKASKPAAKEEKKPEKPASPEPTPPPKPEYITRKIGGKIRRIPVSSLKKAEEKKAEKKPEKKVPKKVPKITVTEAEDDGPKEEPEVKAKLPPKSKQNLKLRVAPKKAKSAPAKSDELKALKKQLKDKGVSKLVLKFIKSVEQAKEKLEELEEEEEDDDDSKVIPQFLTMVSSKDRKEVEKLVLLVLPSKEYSKADQRDYLRDLKDMAEEWPNSAKPRIKYDEFPEAEKELFRMLFPAIFAVKPKEPKEEKKKKKVTKSKKNVE